MSLLPSAAFYVADSTKDDEKAFRFVGGGLGHGAGMSQSGACRMAEEGKNYTEILAHYFTGTKLRDLSELN
jgi:stage II sporulation protein D